MKKLKLFSLLMLLFVGVTNMWGDVGELYYTFLPYKPDKGAVSDYTQTGTMTIDEKDWTVPGNWYGNGALRLGGKSLNKVDRTIIGQDTLGIAIAKIRIAHAGKTADAITLNSVTVTTASDASFTKDVTTKTVTSFTVAKNTKDTIDIVPTTEPWPKDSYYKIAFNLSNSNSSNYAFVVEKILFYAYEAASSEPTVSVNPASLDFSNVLMGSSPDPKIFAISGSNLTADVTITAPTGFQVAEWAETPSYDESVTLSPSTGAIEATDIVVKPITSNYGTFDGNITISGGGLTKDSTVAVKMTVGGIVTITNLPDSWAFGEVLQGDTRTNYKKTFHLNVTNLSAYKELKLDCGAGFTTNPTNPTADENGVVDADIEVYPSSTDETGEYTNKSLQVMCTGDREFKDSTFVNNMSMTIVAAKAVTVPAITGGTLTWNGGAAPSLAKVGATATLVATPTSPYTGGTITILRASDDKDVTTTVMSGATLTMPDYAIKVVVSFTAPACTVLATPSVTVAEKDYNNTKLTWGEVEHADAYEVEIKKGETTVESDIVETLSYTVTEELLGATEYTYFVRATSENTTDYCTSIDATATFETNAYPTATLTLSENGKTRTLSGSHKLYDVVNLPSTVETSVIGKVFMGWSADAERATAPELAKDAEYTLNATSQTLYAVYATETPGSTSWNVATSIAANDVVVISTNAGYSDHDMKTAGSISSSLMSCKASSYNNDKSQITTVADGTLEFTVGGNATDGWTFKNGTKYLASTAAKKVALQADAATWSVSFSGNVATVTFSTDTYGSLQYNYNSGTDRFTTYTSAQVGISLYKKVTTASTYSEYATIGPRKLANPGIAPAAGTYTAAQTITLTNNDTEGKIYYNIDSEDAPTTSSTEYTAPFELNTYGEHTVKAITINGDNVSEVVSATYKLELPFASLEALVAQPLAAEDSVTVSFSNIAITDFYYSNSKSMYCGVYLNVKGANDKNIEIFKNGLEVPEAWIANGTLSGTLRAKWTHYTQYDNDIWELVPGNSFAWDNLTYTPRYAVTFNAPEHGTLSVKKQVGENWEAITSGNYFVEGTVLKVEAEPESADYKLALTVNGEAFTSGNTFTIGTAAVAVSATFTEKADPEISWSNSGAAVEVQLGGDYTALPTLTKGDFSVTCESTDAAVATVDNDGVVTPKSAGTTTIKAIFAGDADNKAKTVSYELTVTAPDFYIAGDFTDWGTNKIPVGGESKTLNLAAGSHKLKVVDGEDWKGFSNLTVSEIIAGLTADGEGNICFTLAEEGNVTVTYTNELFKLEGDFTPQTVKLKGGWDSWAEHTMTVSDDKKSASVKMTLTAAENVQFGIDIDGDYRANNYYYHRDYTGTTGITGNDGNMKLTSDIDGDYTFTWTFGTNGINITFPMVEAGLSWGVDAASAYTAGKSYTLPTLANPNSRPVSYESSNEAVATIANDGKITLVAAGTTVIKATSEATSLYTAGEASYTLNVYAPTVVVTGNLTVSAYEYGDEFSYAGLGAKAVYGDESEYELPSGGLQWTYNPTRVTENGKVQVTVTYATISSAAKEFDVTVKTHAVTFEQPEGGTLVVKKGETTVSSGEAFVKGTELTITATRESADYVFASLTVNGEDFTSGNTFTVGTANIEVAAEFELKPAAPISWESTEDDVREYGKSYENNDWRTLYNNGNFEVTVTSSNAAVIETMKPYNSSNTTGIWYPEAVKGVGTTTITATTAATDSYRQTSVSYKIVVKAGLDPTAFGWSADVATIYIAAAEKVFPTLTNDLDLDVTYSSSDETKATIDENGVITPKAVGTTTISAIFAGNETYVAKTVTYTLTIAAGDGTALDNTADETKAVKFLENGQIFILRGDKVYTVDGQLVK